MKKVNAQLVQEWFAIGEEEFNFADASLKEFDAYYSSICFEFQQAAEKYLKGYLVAQRNTVPKIHDLTSLIKLCGKCDAVFLDCMDAANYLSQFYLISRYPIAEYPSARKHEANKAHKAAEKIIQAVLSSVHLE